MNRIIFASLLIIFSMSSSAEPWISTDKGWLRSDIEALANIGVIQTPITTWPLIWGSVLKDLSRVNISQIPESYQSVYLRVVRQGKKETGNDSSSSEIRFGFNGEPQLFRYFGDKVRGKREVATRTTGMSSNFAWNLEVTLTPDSVDGDDKRFDGSYFAGVLGNWIFSVGQIEKWWGPGWQHSIILSNNAKPVPAISVQRNYSEPFESSFLKWVGPWTFTAFLSSLDDERQVNDAKFIGISGSIKPFDSLEVGFRRTAQWGGDGRPENFDSIIDMLIGLDNCDEDSSPCDGLDDEPGNQLAGIDVIWRPNTIIPASFYFQTVGEDEAGYAPSKKSFLYGINVVPEIFEQLLSINVEYIDTQVDGDGNVPGVPFSGYNVLYEHRIYGNGYRYSGRSIGSTIDNDSRMLSLAFIYRTEEYGNFNFRFTDSNLNRDSDDVAGAGGHSITGELVELSETALEWEYVSQHIGEFKFNVTSRDRELDTKLGMFETTSLGLEWSFQF